ncbi:MAG: hypothetical protein HY714_05700 [Candidatus Omnitrophica bacterium]|nr:hypothetical protein [Candidatus Omnitrophota bacterium]
MTGESKWMTGILSDPGTAEKFRKFRPFAAQAAVRDFQISKGVISGVVEDRENKFGVTLRVSTVPESVWEDLTRTMAEEGRFSADLLSGRMPEGIEDVFGRFQVSLYPRSPAEVYVSCECSEEPVWCRHGARLYLCSGEALEKDPFLLFAVKGKAREALLTDLRVKRPAAAPSGEWKGGRQENPEDFWVLRVPAEKLREIASAIPPRRDSA